MRGCKVPLCGTIPFFCMYNMQIALRKRKNGKDTSTFDALIEPPWIYKPSFAFHYISP
jgi:hypothetical protein